MKRFLSSMAVVVVASHAGVALAECPVIDFQDLGVGTAVTTQYSGVTISVQGLPASCGTSFARVEVPAQGTSSPTRAICVDGGSTPTADCEFHPQWLRMVFADPHGEVRFAVGPGNTEDFQDYEIRAYSTTSGGAGLLSTTSITDAGDGVYRNVVVTAAGGNIRRIEIQGMAGANSAGNECIDDLGFLFDDTPPTASIISPVGNPTSHAICACGTLSILGVACDDDGAYGMDMLEYRLAAGGPWIFVNSFTTPVCVPGFLYSWNTAPGAIPEDFYQLRLTVENACELSAADFTTVYVDKHFELEEAEIRSPVNNGVYGGAVCFDGTVWDRCFESYRVDYRPAAGGAFLPVVPGTPVFTSTVITDPLATWNTGGVVADGSYQGRVRGTDLCGNVAEVLRTFTVDNTAPTSLITTPANCEYVDDIVEIRGTATDANLENWSLSYTGGSAHGWVLIDSGNVAVNDNVLANWDTTGLPRCAYALRLRVTDRALVDCTANRHVSDYYITVNVGYCGDFDADDDGDVDLIDFSAFQDEFTGPVP